MSDWGTLITVGNFSTMDTTFVFWALWDSSWFGWGVHFCKYGHKESQKEDAL